MATSFVEFKNYGFWAHDEFLEGLLYLIVKEVETLAIEKEWKEKIIEDWTTCYSAGFCGCIPLNLNESLVDQTKVDLLVGTLRAIVKKIQNDNDYLTIDELNDNSVGGHGSKWLGINKEGFLRTAHMTIDLLENKLRTDASSPLGYLKF